MELEQPFLSSNISDQEETSRTDSSSPESDMEQLRNGLDLSYYQPLLRAALEGDWETAKNFFDTDPNAVRAIISLGSRNALHTAASAGRSKFVERLVELMTPGDLAMLDSGGRTALHDVAKLGTVDAAKAIVMKNSTLLLAECSVGYTPLDFAVSLGVESGRKKMIRYLVEVTPDEIFHGHRASRLILTITTSGFFDITLYLLERYPHLATIGGERQESTILEAISSGHSPFRSASNLNFWENFIYSIVPDPVINSENYTAQHRNDISGQRLSVSMQEQISNLAKVPGLNKVYDVKEKHCHSAKLVQLVCKEVLLKDRNFIFNYFLYPDVLYKATENGTLELVEICLQFFPDMLWYHDRTLIHAAITQRREKLFMLIADFLGMNVRHFQDEYPDGNILHVTAILAPSAQLNSISGAPFQFQRELLWFKEVEKLVNSYCRTERNSSGEIPREVFTRKHKDLVKKGEEWMKSTATSCMVVATLLTTVAFSAAFTVHGANSSKVTSNFMSQTSFLVFAISDALALFSSTTSILIFLAVLTARFAEDDFLEILPKKLMGGLSCLLVGIGTMMIAFGAALEKSLRSRFDWIYILVIVLGSVPVILFIRLQLPLFIRIFLSIYGPGIFCRPTYRKWWHFRFWKLNR